MDKPMTKKTGDIAGTYQATAQRDNGDWSYITIDRTNFHDACASGLDLAFRVKGRLIRVERLSIDD